MHWKNWKPGVCALALLAGACQSSSTRHGAYEATEADHASRLAFDPDLMEFSDQVARRLIADLGMLPEIRRAQTRKVLALGALENHTSTPTSDFESIQARIRGRLLGSEWIRADFVVIQDPAITRRDRARLVDAPADLLQEGTGSDLNTYAPEDTYVLQGEFWERERFGESSSVQRFYFAFSLVNLQTNAIVFSSDYDLTQVR